KNVTGQRQRIQRVNSILSIPPETAQKVSVKIGRIGPGKAYDVAAFIDGHRRVPKPDSEVADVDNLAVIPQHCVFGGVSADGLVADACYSHDLSTVINSRRGSAGVAGDQWELLDLICIGTPHHWTELEHLCSHACRIVDTILRPSDDAAPVVSAGGEAIVAAWNRIKRLHRSLLPYETETGKSSSSWSREESEAAPIFSVRFRRVGLRDSGDDSSIVFHRPRHAAVLVGSAKC